MKQATKSAGEAVDASRSFSCTGIAKLCFAPLGIASVLGALRLSLGVSYSIDVDIDSPRDYGTISSTDHRDVVPDASDATRLSPMTARKAAEAVTRKPKRPSMQFSEDIATGILSKKSSSFFRGLQQKVDDDDPHERCHRYGFFYDPNSKKRRLFYGSLLAEEPEELLEIVAAESYGIYTGMVFVESNRTQNFAPRPIRRVQQVKKLEALFGMANISDNDSSSNLQVRVYVNEKEKFTGIRREHAQRQEILRGWKELGMTQEDVGVLADADETFSRDFLRAVQQCQVPALDYSSHRCHTSNVKIAASSRVFETSPECVTAVRGWYHPDMVLGHCIEMIGNRSIHPVAFRDGPRRAHGYGRACSKDFSKLTPGQHPLWSAADFRMLCGQQAIRTDGRTGHSTYTGFHFHNFFTDFNATRVKYHTYGHATKARKAFAVPLNEIGKNDLNLMYNCVRGLEGEPNQKWSRIMGGLNASLPPIPIYFQDLDYRRRRHEWVQEQVRLDDEQVKVLQREWNQSAIVNMIPQP